jgi:hypothetical protein
VKAYKYGDANNNPAGLVPGLVMLWCRRGEHGLLLVENQALFGTVPQADLRRLVDIDGITRITAPDDGDITFQQQDENWTINVSTDLFGFHERQEYVQLFNKYAAAITRCPNPNHAKLMKRVCFMLKRQVYETQEAPTFQIDVNEIWRKYQGIYNDWKDNVLQPGNDAAVAAVVEIEAAAAAAGGVDNLGTIEVDFSDEEE